MPRRLATASAVVRLSPVSMTTRDAVGGAAPASAAGVVALTGSAMAMTPASLPSTARNIAVAPSRRSRSASSRQRGGVDVRVRRECCVAEREALALDHADDALAGGRIEVARASASVEPALRGGRDDRRGQRMLAAALEAGRKAQHLRLVEAGAPA